jgi:glycosyltransferase involved in cell wall biosynthesis
MSLGLSVIASRIEAYTEAVNNLYDGFIVDGINDWIKSLEYLKDPVVRLNFGLRARQKALTEYSTEKIGLDYLSMIYFLLIY